MKFSGLIFASLAATAVASPKFFSFQKPNSTTELSAPKNDTKAPAYSEPSLGLGVLRRGPTEAYEEKKFVAQTTFPAAEKTANATLKITATSSHPVEPSLAKIDIAVPKKNATATAEEEKPTSAFGKWNATESVPKRIGTPMKTGVESAKSAATTTEAASTTEAGLLDVLSILPRETEAASTTSEGLVDSLLGSNSTTSEASASSTPAVDAKASTVGTNSTATTHPAFSATATGVDWTSEAPQKTASATESSTESTTESTTVGAHAFNSAANSFTSSSTASATDSATESTTVGAHAFNSAANSFTSSTTASSSGHPFYNAHNGTAHAGSGRPKTTFATVTSSAKKADESASSTHVDLVQGQITQTVSDTFNATSTATSTTTDAGLLGALSLKAKRTATSTASVEKFELW